MTAVTIVCTDVIPPSAGKKRWNIKDSNGNIYGVMPPLANVFSAGASYNIDYHEDIFRNVSYKVIDSAIMVGATIQQQARQHPMQPVHHQTVVPQERAVPPRPAATPRSYGQTDMETAKRIFVCGAVNSSLQNANINPLGLNVQEGTNLTNMWRTIWDNTFGGNAQRDDDMNDEIPFK